MNKDYEGQGGSYVIDEGGQRKLVERTRVPGETPPDPAGPSEQAAHSEPAEAGFSSPGVPAESTTTTE